MLKEKQMHTCDGGTWICHGQMRGDLTKIWKGPNSNWGKLWRHGLWERLPCYVENVIDILMGEGMKKMDTYTQ